MIQRRHKAILWVVSGPSGSGKTTLCGKLIRQGNLNIARSVSCTTRSLRQGEKNYRDYIFISREAFRAKIRQGDFLEWKEVFGNLYGTPEKRVRSLLRHGKDVLLCIDVKGAMEIKRKLPKQTVSIFVVPPNARELARRIRQRARESGRELKRRLAFAQTEITFAKHYDYTIINDELKNALEGLKSIIIAKRLENVIRTD